MSAAEPGDPRDPGWTATTEGQTPPGGGAERRGADRDEQRVPGGDVAAARRRSIAPRRAKPGFAVGPDADGAARQGPTPRPLSPPAVRVARDLARARRRPLRRSPSSCASSATRPGCRTSTTPTRTATSSRARSGCSATARTRTTSSTRPPSRTSSTRSSRVRWGTDPATIGGAFAADPTTAFALARAAIAFLGALAVSLTAIAGARLFDDRRVGVLAGALLAVAFLPSHYSHFALNDAPTLAPLAAALIGIAGIYRTGRTREYVLAGLGLGVAIATKYTAGILLVTLVAAAFASPVAHARRAQPGVRDRADVRRVRGRQPVRAARPQGVPRRAGEADRDRGRGRRQARPGEHERLDLLPGDVHVGPGLAAVAVRARRRRGADRAPPAARAAARARADPAVPLPRPAVALLRPLDAPDLPDPLHARRLRGDRPGPARSRAPQRRSPPPRCRRSCWLQGLVFSVHNDLVLAKADTRQVARDWMVQNIPSGTNIVVEPIAPDQWAMDAGHPLFEKGGRDRLRQPLEQVAHVALLLTSTASAW